MIVFTQFIVKNLGVAECRQAIYLANIAFIMGMRLTNSKEEKMALMEISLMPVGQGTSMSKYIAKAILVLKQEPGIEYELTSMGTIVLGEVDHLLAVSQKMHQAVKDAGAPRIVTTIKIDDRLDKPITLTSKLESLKAKLRKDMI
jgi:uncharacterized protein (TIGR00106 family)